MPSLLAGYSYDIFISYRQKDNKGDHWVSGFVEALKTELESTFKEEISVYFDINPHDGLLETHDVDASLKEKLKCLIFIPIISRTYCDPKSFAWEHEFKAFVEIASKDQFGLKVKLQNGNVASRVLPVRIHELDAEDIMLFEKDLNGRMRAIEFIYKEPGVDKPLTPTDDEKKNLSNTKYRIQVIKVVNAIKEILLGMKMQSDQIEKGKDQSDNLLKIEKKTKNRNIAKGRALRLSILILLASLLFISGIIALPKMLRINPLDDLRSSSQRISVLVMPFQNMTNDTGWNIWQEGIQSELISNLSNSDDLIVKQWDILSNMLQYYTGANTFSKGFKIASKLDADVFIMGNIKQSGTHIRINAEIVHTDSKEILKSFSTGALIGNKEIFYLTDSLSRMITEYLLITVLKRETTPAIHVLGSTKNPDALKNYIDGASSFFKGDYSSARDQFTSALNLDPDYSLAKVMLSHSYLYEGSYDKAKELILDVYKTRDGMSRMDKLFTEWSYAFTFGYPSEQVKFLKQMIEQDDQNAAFHSDLGETYLSIRQYPNAILQLEEALRLFNLWRIKPMWVNCYTSLGKAYHETRQFEKEKALYEKAEKDFPDEPSLLQRQAILFFSTGNNEDGERYLSKYITVCNGQLIPDEEIKCRTAYIYANSGKLDKAGKLYRQALAMDPDNPEIMNMLSYFLIYNNLNIDEGLLLARNSLTISPDNYNYLNTLGLALLKQHKIEESLKMLQKSWNLRMTHAVYDHEAFLNLEEAIKAFESQKSPVEKSN